MQAAPSNGETPIASGCTPELYRSVMGCFPTGVTVVTVRGADGAKVGVTASSFNTVSIDPPLILWSLSLRAPSLAAFRAAENFAVNVLEEGQDMLARQFSRPAADKFAGISTLTGMTGAPLIEGALAHIECRVAERYAGGDHEIMLGEVVAVWKGAGEPLVFRGGRFCRIAPH
jgi:flavin reductase (DIM6/NTAB) family NADH-FMN oxidoreductase RutF